MSRKSRGSLKVEDEWAIRDNFVYLHKELEPASICLHLFEAGILDKDDLEEIRSCKTRKRKAEKLIEKLLHAGPDDAYEVFLGALEKEQKPIVQRLKLSALERAANERCPSPQNIPRELPEDERLRQEVKALKKLNENLWKEKVNLERKLAILEEENSNLLRNINEQRWEQHNHSGHHDSRKVYRSQYFLESDLSILYRSMLEMLTNIDESLEKILTFIHIDITDFRWQNFFNFLAFANFEKSLNVLLGKGIGSNLFAKLSRTIVLYKPTTSNPAEILHLEGVMTSLMSASANGSHKTLQLLLDAGADVNTKDEFGDTALIHLCRGIDIENPIHRDLYSITNGPTICIERLLEKEADIDVQGKAGMTAVMHCAMNGNERYVRYLVQNKHANLNIKCHRGKTALLYMADNHWRDGFLLDIFYSSDKNTKDQNGNTLLLLSIQMFNYTLFMNLLQWDADVCVQNDDGISPLMLAINLKLDEFINPLLPHVSGCINLKDKAGNTALLLATDKQMSTAALSLLDVEGIDVNVQNYKGETALMVAAKYIDLELVSRLISAGAKCNLRDCSGRSALKHVRNSSSTIILERDDVKDLLLKEGAIE